LSGGAYDRVPINGATFRLDRFQHPRGLPCGVDNHHSQAGQDRQHQDDTALIPLERNLPNAWEDQGR
jgi:hypothetical protein